MDFLDVRSIGSERPRPGCVSGCGRQWLLALAATFVLLGCGRSEQSETAATSADATAEAHPVEGPARVSQSTQPTTAAVDAGDTNPSRLEAPSGSLPAQDAETELVEGVELIPNGEPRPVSQEARERIAADYEVVAEQPWNSLRMLGGMTEAERAWIVSSGLPWMIRHKQFKIRFVLIPPGSFTAGITAAELELVRQHGRNMKALAREKFDQFLVNLPGAQRPRTIDPMYVALTPITLKESSLILGRELELKRWESYGESAQSAATFKRLTDGGDSISEVLEFLRRQGMTLPTAPELEYMVRANRQVVFEPYRALPEDHAFRAHPWGLETLDKVGGEICLFVGIHRAIAGDPKLASRNPPPTTTDAVQKFATSLISRNDGQLRAELEAFFGVEGVVTREGVFIARLPSQYGRDYLDRKQREDLLMACSTGMNYNIPWSRDWPDLPIREGRTDSALGIRLVLRLVSKSSNVQIMPARP